MRRLLLGFAIGTGLAYGWRTLLGTADEETQPSWKGTDNDPEDLALDDALADRVRPADAIADTENPLETPERPGS